MRPKREEVARHMDALLGDHATRERDVPPGFRLRLGEGPTRQAANDGQGFADDHHVRFLEACNAAMVSPAPLSGR